MDEPVDHRFHRPPREFPAIPPSEPVKIGAPPHKPGRGRESWLYVLFPVVGSATLFAYAIIYDNPLFFWIAGLLVTVTLAFALALRWTQRRQGKLSAREQRQRYRKHLKTQDETLAQLAAVQARAADRLYPDPARLWGQVLRRSALWERRPGDDDFLRLRLGRGPVAHAAAPQLDLGFNPMADHEEELVAEANAVVDRWETLARQPVIVDLAELGVLTIAGPAEPARSLTRALLLQLAVSRAPGDLLIACSPAPASGDADAGPWAWLKWSPHARRPGADGSGPPVPLLPGDAHELSELLERLVVPRLEQQRSLAAAPGVDRRELEAPELVLVLEDLHPLDPRLRLPVLRETLARGRDLNVSVICLVRDPSDEPAESRAKLELPERGASSLRVAGPGGAQTDAIEADAIATGSAEAIARALAPIRLVGVQGASGRHAGDSLQQLLGLPPLARLDPRQMWATRPRSLALRTPVGISPAGEIVHLDLKQAAEGGMGPHGLIIGATGSGKSELLRTLVAGLALGHSPDDLAFVFVDFKGGAALAELAELPHTAGLITNLQRDLSLVDRMHDALYGEQERRQSMLRDAGNLDDVLQYRRRRAEDPSMEPLPDLIVLIDEFGELLAARPDFIDLFVAIGRVGRSLGIHLLFSSQRFDEGRLRGLESHLRYRLCLRTNTVVESKGVIGTPDAALLPPEPGLGFLRVDASTYERFRTSLLTSEDPAARSEQARAARSVASFGGRAGAGDGDPGRDTAATGAAIASGIRELTTALRRAAPPVRRIWLPPLDDALPLDSVLQQPQAGADGSHAEALQPAIGIVDLPREQRREVLRLDLAGGGGNVAVIGASRTGKSSALRTLVLSLAASHGPGAVQFAAIDLGGGGLRTLSDLPHVRAVAGRTDRELVRLVVTRIRAELSEREQRFRAARLDDMADARRRRARGLGPEDGGLPDVFLVIDGWAQLRRDHEGLDLEIEELIGSGLAYGIHVVIAASRWADLRPAVADGLGSRIELRLGDPIESEIERRANEAIPEDRPGRALTAGARLLQVALPRLDGLASGDALGDASTRAAAHVAGLWDGEPRAARIQALPTTLLPADLQLATSTGGDPHADEDGLAVTIGVDEDALAPVAVDLGSPEPHLLVLGDAESGRTTLLRTLARGLASRAESEGARIWIVDPRRSLGDLAGMRGVSGRAVTPSEASALATRLAADATARLPQAGQPAAAGHAGPAARDILLVDDYDLLVGPEGNPLAPLVPLIAYGPDAGLHLVLARRVTGTTRAAFEPLLQRITELRVPGIMLSGDPGEGPLLDGHRPRPLPPGRGLLIRRGRMRIVQTVLTDPSPAAAGPAATRHP